MIKTETERDMLIDQLAVAYAYLRYRAPHGGGYPRPAELKAARQEITTDPACAKILAPGEGECAALLRQHGFTPPVVRKVDQKKT